MNTYLGVSSSLDVGDLDVDAIAAGAVLYMEGYLFDRDDAKAAFRHAATIAHANGRQVSLTLSDSFCVDRHRVDFRSLVQDSVDILFGNADEIRSLYEVDDLDVALKMVRYHSLYAWHERDAYDALQSRDDALLKGWVKLFNTHDLYSKRHVPVEEADVREYYDGLVRDYLPLGLRF